MKKQAATGNRKELSNSLPNALRFKSSNGFGFTLEQYSCHYNNVCNSFILTFSQVKSTENPAVSHVGNVYCTYSEPKNFLNLGDT